MKGLTHIPTESDLLKAYNKLQSKQVLLPELCLFSQWTRFDPRLAELMIRYLYKHWKGMPAALLNAELLKNPWPSIFGVLCEHVLQLCSKQEKLLFKKWMECSLLLIPKANYEQYFIGLRKFAGQEMLKDSIYALKPYRKWGYLARDWLIPKSINTQKTLLSKKTRLQILKKLIKSKKPLTVRLYRQATGNLISTRQAQRDLREQKLHYRGRTRNRVYFR